MHHCQLSQPAARCRAGWAGAGRARPATAARGARGALARGMAHALAAALALTLVLAPPAAAQDGGTGQAKGAASANGTGPDGSAARDIPVQVDPSEVTADSLISRHQSEPRDPNRGPVTNLPLPRYVSLKGSEGNARRGPSLSHRIDWVFRHPGMPLRVVAEFGHWRRVEDQDGAGGWVHYSLLSGVRTAIVTTDMAELRARPDANAAVIARAEAGAIVRLHECEIEWCRVSGGGAKGWVVKAGLWGVDPDETRE